MEPEEIAQLIGIGVQEAVAEAIRLGVQWQMRMGTVFTTGDRPLVLIDGDTKPIPTLPIAGRPIVGNRVMVCSVPPALNVIIGGTVGYPRPLTNSNLQRLGSNLVLTTSTQSLCSVTTTNTREGAVYIVTANLSFNVTGVASASTDAIGILEIDGVQQTGRARGNCGTLGALSGFQQWIGTLTTGGTHLFDFTGVKGAATPTVTALSNDTTIVVSIYG